MGRPVILAALCCMLARAASGQAATRQADSAWDAGDRTLARRLYLEVLAQDPENSRAVFRTAALSPDRSEAVRLYRRYTELEPRNTWGWIALGEALSRRGKHAEALAAYDHAAALEPGERDVGLGRARALSRAGRRESAALGYTAWLASHPEDGEAWAELGREWLRAGRPGRAERAFAEATARHRDVEGARKTAAAQRAPALEPGFGYQGDSDGIHNTRLGLTADVAAGDGSRLGVSGSRTSISDGLLGSTLTTGGLRLLLRPRASTQVTLSGGALRFDPGADGAATHAFTGLARLRWRAPDGGPAIDLRAEREPLGTTPQLVGNEAMRNEVRGMLDIPLGSMRLRSGGRLGTIRSAGETNKRWMLDEILAVPVGTGAELSMQYHRVHYADPSATGYFAPNRVETLEGGTYLELERPGVTFALDLGAGAQRITLHPDPQHPGGPGSPPAAPLQGDPGSWRLALRGWAALTIPLAHATTWLVEVEGYRAPFAPSAVAPTSDWRYLALWTGIRLALR